MEEQMVTPIRGHIDGFFECTLRGWASDIVSPNTQLELNIVVDGITIGKCIANLYRPDLKSAGIGEGNHGFVFELSNQLIDDRPHTIHVVTSNSMRPLSNSPVSIVFSSSGSVNRIEPSTNVLSEDVRHELKSLDWTLLNNRTLYEDNKWKKYHENSLIVGSAPTIGSYEERIRQFSGEIWALNDAIFWLNEKKIPVDRLFVTDTRFFRKNEKELKDATYKNIVTINTVDPPACFMDARMSILKSLGRDGFSPKFGEVFHGCSVFFTALQCAVSLKYRKIRACGVLFSPPGAYTRFNGTTSLPEYVHHLQIANARRAMNYVRRGKLDVEFFEETSNLNFL